MEEEKLSSEGIKSVLESNDRSSEVEVHNWIASWVDRDQKRRKRLERECVDLAMSNEKVASSLHSDMPLFALRDTTMIS